MSVTLDPNSFASAIDEQGIHGRFKCSIGSTNTCSGQYLLDVHNDEVETEENNMLEYDIDFFSIDAMHADPPKGVNAEHLSKVWRIDLETAKQTLDVTTQLCKRTTDPTLSHNYSTNDRMLQY